MYQLRYREELPPAVVKELDDLVATYNNLLSQFLNDDGSVNWPKVLGIPQPKPDTIYNPPDSPLLADFLEAMQAQGQRWKSGPWTFEDTHGAKPNAAVRAIGVSSSSSPTTLNNFTAEGLGGCVALEFSSQNTDIVLTGIDLAGLGATRRCLVIGNTGTSGKLVTLNHADTNSSAPNRFKFQDSQNIVLADGQYSWVYYSPSAGRWIGFVTGNNSGGVVGYTQLQTAVAGISSDFKVAYKRITDAQIKAILTTPITVIAAQGANTVVEVQSCFIYLNRQVNYTNNPAGSLRYAGDTTDITNSGVFLQTSATPGTRMTRFSINSSNQSFDASTVAINKAVVWRGGQDNTAGDAANFLDVFVTYRVFTVIP